MKILHLGLRPPTAKQMSDLNNRLGQVEMVLIDHELPTEDRDLQARLVQLLATHKPEAFTGFLPGHLAVKVNEWCRKHHLTLWLPVSKPRDGNMVFDKWEQLT